MSLSFDNDIPVKKGLTYLFVLMWELFQDTKNAEYDGFANRKIDSRLDLKKTMVWMMIWTILSTQWDMRMRKGSTEQDQQFESNACSVIVLLASHQSQCYKSWSPSARPHSPGTSSTPSPGQPTYHSSSQHIATGCSSTTWCVSLRLAQKAGKRVQQTRRGLETAVRLPGLHYGQHVYVQLEGGRHPHLPAAALQRHLHTDSELD